MTALAITLTAAGTVLAALAGLVYAGAFPSQSPTFHRETIAARALGVLAVALLVVGVTTGLVGA